MRPVGVVLVMAVALTSLFVLRRRPTEETASAIFGRAALTRPTEATPGLSGQLRVLLNGTDWLLHVPEVRTGSKCSVEFSFKGQADAGQLNAIHVYVRPTDRPDFSFSDFRIDQSFVVGKPRSLWQMQLSPGEYTARLYLETTQLKDFGKTPPKVDLICERPLTIIGPADSSRNKITPGESPRDRLPVVVVRYGSRHPLSGDR
jgi:hypothetical protein